MGIKQVNVTNFMIRPIRLSQLQHIPTDVLELMQYTAANNLKPNCNLRIGRKVVKPICESLWDHTWGEVIEIKTFLKDEQHSEVIKLMYGVTDAQLLKATYFNYFGVYLWIAERALELMRIEADNLPSDNDPKLVEAGIERLQELGPAVIARRLCPDLTKRDEYYKLPYSVIFQEMVIMATEQEISRNLQPK